MNTHRGFFDLNISEEIFKNKCANKMFDMLIKMGYKTVAINQLFNDISMENTTSKKKKKGENKIITDIIPEPINLDNFTKEYSGKLKILNRLTLTISNQNHFHKIKQSENFKKYDLLAVNPMNQTIFQFLCSIYDFDILTFDPQTKIPIKLNRKMYNLSREKKIFYELLYSPLIMDSTCRKNLISTGHLYHAVGKSEGIIISSGATNELQIRGPYDIVNLGLLFGLSEEQSKAAILNTSLELLTKAECKRYGKSVVIIKHLGPSTSLETTTHIKDCSDNEDEDEDLKLLLPPMKKLKFN